MEIIIVFVLCILAILFCNRNPQMIILPGGLYIHKTYKIIVRVEFVFLDYVNYTKATSKRGTMYDMPIDDFRKVFEEYHL